MNKYTAVGELPESVQELVGLDHEPLPADLDYISRADQIATLRMAMRTELIDELPDEHLLTDEAVRNWVSVSCYQMIAAIWRKLHSGDSAALSYSSAEL